MTPEDIQEANIKSRERCLNAFTACKTKEELKASAQVLGGVINKLPEKDKEWLRTMYESCMHTILYPGNPLNSLTKAGKKWYKENVDDSQ